MPRTAAADGIFEKSRDLAPLRSSHPGQRLLSAVAKYNRVADAVRSADAASIANRVGEQFGDPATSAPKTSAASPRQQRAGLRFKGEAPACVDPYTPAQQFSEPKSDGERYRHIQLHALRSGVGPHRGVMNLVAKGKVTAAT